MPRKRLKLKKTRTLPVKGGDLILFALALACLIAVPFARTPRARAQVHDQDQSDPSVESASRHDADGEQRRLRRRNRHQGASSGSSQPSFNQQQPEQQQETSEPDISPFLLEETGDADSLSMTRRMKSAKKALDEGRLRLKPARHYVVLDDGKEGESMPRE